MEEKLTVDPKDAQDNTLMGILAYLGILVIIPIIAAKESPFARFHANQGLILCLGIIAVYITTAIFGTFFAFIWWRLAYLIAFINGIAGLGYLIFAVLGIVNVTRKEMKELPYIGSFKILK